jgi:hypothetical protein
VAAASSLSVHPLMCAPYDGPTFSEAGHKTLCAERAEAPCVSRPTR